MNDPLVRPDDERALLGTLIVNPRAYAQIASITRSEQFTESANRAIWEAIEAQCRSGMPANLPSLEFHFKEEWSKPLAGTKQTLGQYCSDLITFARPFDFVGMASELKQLWLLREMSVACEAGRVATGQTPRAVIDEAFARLETLRAALAEDENTLSTGGAAVGEAIDRARAILNGDNSTAAVTTGLIDLDREIIGYRPGTVVTVAGRPGMGKTAFATSSGLRVAAAGVGCGIFSLELMRHEIGARMASDRAYTSSNPVTFADIMRGHGMDPRKLNMVDEAKAKIDDLPIEIDAVSSLTLFDLSARIRQMKRRFAAKGVRLGVVFIDYLSHLNVSDRYKGNRTLEIGEIMAGLRLICKEQELCIVLLAQLNRGVEGRDDKRPDLADLRDSGEIEQRSDAVLFLYREAYYLEKSKEVAQGDIEACERLRDVKNDLQIIIAKNRGGRVTTVTTFCEISCSAIRDRSRFQGPGRAVG